MELVQLCLQASNSGQGTMSMQINDEWHAAGYMKSVETEMKASWKSPVQPHVVHTPGTSLQAASLMHYH